MKEKPSQCVGTLSAGEVIRVGLFDRLRSRRPRARRASPEDTAHLRSWAAQRRGVEAYVEPPTAMTETTVILIAHDGEWTRRRIGGLAAAQHFAHDLGIPCYEVTKVGYPQRMRDYLARQRIRRKRDQRRALED